MVTIDEPLCKVLDFERSHVGFEGFSRFLKFEWSRDILNSDKHAHMVDLLPQENIVLGPSLDVQLETLNCTLHDLIN